MTALTSASFPKHPSTFWISYGAILLLALLFRFLPIQSGLPYSDYVDEGHVLHQTINAVNHQSIDVGWYGLPALPAYSAGAALFLYGPLYRHFHGHRFQDDLPNDPSLPGSRFNYDLITPVELIVAGRIVTACLSVGSVILAGMIALRLANHRACLLAMLLVALTPALVTRGSIVIVDTFATFFVLVTLYSCLRITPTKTVWRDLFLAGFGTGLVFASKYPAAIVGVVLLTTILGLQVPWSRRLQFMALAAGSALLGILLGAPMTFFEPVAVWRDITENIRAYGQIPSPHGYFAQAVSMSELGLPLLIVGFSGIILMLGQTKTRAVTVSWILFSVLLIASYLNSSFRPFRSFLSLVPLLCIAAAIALSALVEWAKRGQRPGLRFGAAVLILGGCIGSLGFSSFQQVQRRISHTDSRIQAVDWLQQHTTREESVLSLRELAILPAEWGRVPARSTVVPWFEASALLQSQRFDYIVTGEFDLLHATDPKAWAEYRDGWKAQVSNLIVQADFGQVETPVPLNLWRTNDERILILKNPVK